MADKKKQKFRIRAPRYINGQYVVATPDKPAVIEVEIPPGRKPDPGLELVTEENQNAAPEKLTPHYVVKGEADAPKAAEVHGEVKGDKKRPSDLKV